MSDNSTGVGGGIGLPWLLLLLWAPLAYFVYGGIEGVLAILILGVLYGLATLLSIIPFAGVVIQALLMKFVIWPWVVEFTGITATWLTLWMFWLPVVTGILITIATTIAVIVALSE